MTPPSKQRAESFLTEMLSIACNSPRRINKILHYAQSTHPKIVHNGEKFFYAKCTKNEPANCAKWRKIFLCNSPARFWRPAPGMSRVSNKNHIWQFSTQKVALCNIYKLSYNSSSFCLLLFGLICSIIYLSKGRRQRKEILR